MKLKKIVTLLFLVFFLLPIHQSNAQTNNAGFIPSNIWYSKDPFEDGDKIKIYTLIFNPDSRELSGTVMFYDKTILLGKKTFVVGAKGVKDISIDWTVNSGEHLIFAKIENAKFLLSDGKYEDATINKNKTDESSRTVNKKIIPQVVDAVKSDFVVDQINNIPNLITNNTPDFVAKPMVLGAQTVEEFRNNIGTATESKKKSLSNEIKVLDKKTPSDKKISNDSIIKPWKYLQYFFMSFSSFILNTKIVFYSILAILVFLLLRFIWRKIF